MQNESIASKATKNDQNKTKPHTTPKSDQKRPKQNDAPYDAQKRPKTTQNADDQNGAPYDDQKRPKTTKNETTPKTTLKNKTTSSHLLAYRRWLKWLARSHIMMAQWFTCSHIDDGSNGSLARISRRLNGALVRISTTAQLARSLAYSISINISISTSIGHQHQHQYQHQHPFVPLRSARMSEWARIIHDARSHSFQNSSPNHDDFNFFKGGPARWFQFQSRAIVTISITSMALNRNNNFKVSARQQHDIGHHLIEGNLMEVQWSDCAVNDESDYFFGVSLLPIYFVLSGMRFLVVAFGSICIEIEGSVAKNWW
jgi:hypothetical protein